jgi:hypothetical protein
LNRSAYSPALAKQMVWLSGLLPYDQAAEVFERIGQRVIPRMSIWRQAQQHGERLRAYQEHQQALVSVERVELPDSRADHHQQKGLSLDGGMMNIRGEGWKEFKTGVVFDVEPHAVLDPDLNEVTDLVQGVRMAYAAVLGSVPQFSPAFWALAVAHEVPQAAESSVTADGAEWIWPLAADLFPDSVQIVDWYHATQHLTQAAQALFPDEPEQAHRWYEHQRTALFRGEIWKITQPLDRAGLLDHSRYFHTHQRRMQYQDFREQGYPIGSGTVESGIKQFKTRLAGPVMRWSRPAAERMLVVRAAVLSLDFDHLWAAA